MRKTPGLPGRACPLEIPLAQRAHVDAPLFPFSDDIETFLKVKADHAGVLVLADQAPHGFPEHGLDVRAVDFGDIAAEMIIARGPGPGAAHVAFFQHDNALRAGFPRGDGGHGPADASARDDDIGFKSLSYRNHCLCSFA